jgi:hypothetical protein
MLRAQVAIHPLDQGGDPGGARIVHSSSAETGVLSDDVWTKLIPAMPASMNGLARQARHFSKQ